MDGGRPITRSTAVCFTGHREIPEREREQLFQFTLAHTAALYNRGYRTFIAGGAVGYDMMAGQCVCELKLTHPDARLVLAIPFEGHTDKWTDGDRHQLDELIELADDVVTISGRYSPGVFAARNRWMVDHAQACVCYLRSKNPRSGTAQTVAMARKSRLEIIEI